MRKQKFGNNLLVKILLFGFGAFLLIAFSRYQPTEPVEATPRSDENYPVVIDDLNEAIVLVGNVDADNSTIIIEPINEVVAEDDANEVVGIDEVEEGEEQEPWPERVVFLTIDDGPSRYTEQFLAVLAELSVPATFFLIGEHIEDTLPDSQQLLHRMLAEGHYIGLHSMTHNRATLYAQRGAAERFVTEMLDNQSLVYRLTGHYTNLCRPPFGSRGNFTDAHEVALAATEINCIDWNVDPRDWFYREPEVVYQNVRAGVERLNFPSEVMIVMHETSWTLESLPAIVAFLHEHDYVFKIYTPGLEFNYRNYE